VTAYLFVGPTLPRAEIDTLRDFVCLPPVAQGDVLRLSKSRPQAIGIIDGYFDGVPAVWHKEILWALTQGIHVFGGASMGALRAAELHQFGMRGIGRIFEAYRAGELEDDDEVAVMHGPAATGYVTLAEPMVNIRATLEEAERTGIVTAPTRATLIERAKNLYYQERTWERLLADSGAGGPAAGEMLTLREWLPAGRIDQKRLDARLMIAAMREFLAGAPGPVQATFTFEWTDMWESATWSATARGVVNNETGVVSLDEWVLDELRLDEAAFQAVRQRALLRRLAVDARRSPPPAIDPTARRATEQRLRTRLGLFRRSDLDRWCSENDLDAADFARLVDEETRLAEVEGRLDPNLGRDLLDQLRLDATYGRFAARAAQKRAALAQSGQQDAAPIDVGLTPIVLVAWHFDRCRGGSIPDDLEAYARRLGLLGLTDFYRLLAREWLYSRQGQVGADRR
jgi:hypothetical protein